MGREKHWTEKFLIKSLESAIREQGLYSFREKLRKIVPDISDQYTHTEVADPYIECKVRNMHAFQMSLVQEVIKEFKSPTVVDIGDSSGTQLRYLNALSSKGNKIRSLSVNIDAKAVARVKSKGLEAIHARAEELDKYQINADVFLSFQMLEHLYDPFHFLYNLSTKTQAKYFVVTVPYVRQSRLGLWHLRHNMQIPTYAEDVHIFELSPEDLKLMAQHSGWRVVKEKIYYQYPKWGFWRIAQLVWKKIDFEGFYGMILERDTQWSKQYQDW